MSGPRRSPGEKAPRPKGILRHRPAAASLVVEYAQHVLPPRSSQRTDGAGPNASLIPEQTLSPGTTRSLVVYIEGDGRAWPSRRRPPPDPTPDDPVALKLAANDPAPSVIYIARPCQFLSMDALAACDGGYWADRRFSPEVVDALGQAIDAAKTMAHADTVHLIGFSGGGVVATLLTGRRSDVASLITIASPLDLGAWVAHHGLSPLDGSLDPALSGACGSTVPQVHLVGSDDDVVPAQIILDYARRCGTTPFIRVEINDGFDHQCCWLETWAQRVTTLRR
ncbi:MAG: alpha/beta hydrolase [Rhodospirillales bacterium]|nr:alpha/beta hydrolase [Rhodospirillales bacterium]